MPNNVHNTVSIDRLKPAILDSGNVMKKVASKGDKDMSNAISVSQEEEVSDCNDVIQNTCKSRSGRKITFRKDDIYHYY